MKTDSSRDATKQRSSKKKRMDWVCNACDEPLPSKDAVIAHYRREHREDGWGLWDICGTTGDDFADTTAKEIWRRFREQAATLETANTKAKAYDELIARWNSLCRALQVGQMALDAHRDAFEKEPKK